MKNKALKLWSHVLLLVILVVVSSCVSNKKVEDNFNPGNIKPGPTIVNLAPTASDDSSSIKLNTATSINVVANDTDPEGDLFTITAVGSASHGALVDNGDGTITYTPNADYFGADSFTYTIQDVFGNSDTATVSLTVLGYCASYTQISAIPFTGAPDPFTPTPDGTAGKPYRVCTKLQIDTIASDTTLWDTENFQLWDNIDLDNGGANNGQIGTGATNFTGVFDGNYFTLSNFKFVSPASNDVGFFGVVNTPAVISNLTIDTGLYSVDGKNNVGIVIGRALGGTLTNIHSLGTLAATGAGGDVGAVVGNLGTTLAQSSSSATVTNTGNTTGGLVGVVTAAGYLSDSSTSGYVSASSYYLGGMVGSNNATVDNCQSSATIEETGGNRIGGLVGVQAATASITNSSFSGIINSTKNYVGGIVGQCSGFVSNATVSGIINQTAASTSVGGIVGEIQVCTVSDSIFTGSLTSSSSTVGGIAGTVSSGTITDSVFNGSIKGTSSVGGIAGSNGSKVLNSYSISSNIFATSTSVGGIVGVNQNGGLVSGCYTTADLSFSSASTGGIVGTNFGEVNTSAMLGNLTSISGSGVGGVIGSDRSGGDSNLSNWSLGHIKCTSSYCAGVAGWIYDPNTQGRQYYSLGDIYDSGGSSIGGVIGEIIGTGVGSTALSDSFSFGSITANGNRMGGVIGRINNGNNVDNVFSYSSVYSLGSISGGVIGDYNDYGALGSVVSNIYSRANHYPGSNTFGGIVGTFARGTIQDSYYIGDVSQTSSSSYVGGVAGSVSQNAVVTRTFAQGNVSGGSATSVGFGSNDGTISENYAAGLGVTSVGNLGGLVGVNNVNSVYTDNYWDTTLAGAINDSGDDGDLANITLDTTTNLKDQTTYPVGWDFAADWTMPQGITPGQGYPLLRSNYPCDAVYVAGAYAGTGTFAAPINICNAAQYTALVATSADWDKYIVIADDIDFAGATIGVLGNSTTAFSGTLDGKGHTISNFTINEVGNDNIGIIGYLDGDGNGDLVGDGTVWALNINPNTITGASNVGGAVGYLGTGRIVRVQVTGGNIIGTSNVGGLVGQAGKAWLSFSTSGKIADFGSLVHRSHASATVTNTGSNTGGLVGINAGLVTLSYTGGTVSGLANTGGLVGISTGSITESHSEPSSVTGSAGTTGGGVGSNSGGIVHLFSANAIPGIIGSNSGTVTDTFYDSTLATSASAAGTGLSTAQSSSSANFTNWDFNLHWVEYSSYPNLKWE